MKELPIGQLFAFGFEGSSLDASALQLLKRYKAGGVVLFKRNIIDLEQVVALNASIIEAASDYPPLIAVDQEGGRVQRLKDICTFVPSMRTIGQLVAKHPRLPYQIGAMMARELIALGFNVDFAPVMDVDSNPQNPVIGERSFASDPAEVAKIGSLFIKGMQDGGLAACAKHFPGHGDTDVDSHLALPVLGCNRDRLWRVELVPFYEAVRSGVASVMTAHMRVPALDPEEPATLSEPILTQLLRKQMGFNGLIFSDDINMLALADHYGLETILQKGIEAGVDVFLICKDTSKAQQAIDIVGRLVRDVPDFRNKVEASLSRIQAFKHRYIGAVAKPDRNYARQIVACEPHLELARLWSHLAGDTSKRVSSQVDTL